MPLTEMLNGMLVPRSAVAQGDLVGLGDVAGLDGSKSLTQTFASLPQEFERVGGGALCGSAIRISAVLLDEVRLKRCSYFICRLQRMVDGPVPCGVVNHAASIPRSLLRNAIRGHPRMGVARLSRQDQLRLAVAVYLARFKGASRYHTESDLRCYLAGCRSCQAG